MVTTSFVDTPLFESLANDGGITSQEPATNGRVSQRFLQQVQFVNNSDYQFQNSYEHDEIQHMALCL